MGQAMGSTDGLDASGKQLPQNASADQLGLSGGQMFARKAMQGGLKGLSNGLGQMQPRQPSMMPQINVPQQPTVDPAYFLQGQGGLQKPNFFGQ